MVVYPDIALVGAGLEEQGADLDVGHAHVLQQGIHVRDGLAGVHDVLDDDDTSASEAIRQSDELLDLAGGRCAAVRGHLDEGQLRQEVYVFHQRGREHERAVEHAQEHRYVAVSVVMVQLLGCLSDGLLYLLIGNEKLEILVVKFYSVHNAKVRQKKQK